jgi:hypothetical protein
MIDTSTVWRAIRAMGLNRLGGSEIAQVVAAPTRKPPGFNTSLLGVFFSSFFFLFDGGDQWGS